MSWYLSNSNYLRSLRRLFLIPLALYFLYTSYVYYVYALILYQSITLYLPLTLSFMIHKNTFCKYMEVYIHKFRPFKRY